MNDTGTRHPLAEITPDDPLLGDHDDEPAPHPGLRRAFRIVYIVVVILVITGLILMLFPWRPDRVPLLPDLPWQTISIWRPFP